MDVAIKEAVPMPQSWLAEFVLTQHCVPWKVRLLARAIIPWRVRRFLFHGKANLNTPAAMDRRYSEQGDDFSSMENLYAHILTMIPREDRLLDAGCGIAVLLRQIRNSFPLLELHGTDFSETAVARTQGYGFDARRAVLPDLPYPDNYFKCVVCTEVLEHLDDPVGTVRTFHRVLKPSGMLIVSVPEGLGPDECEEHVQDFTVASLRGCLETGGFSVSSIEVVEREPSRRPGASFLALAVREHHADRR